MTATEDRVNWFLQRRRAERQIRTDHLVADVSLKHWKQSTGASPSILSLRILVGSHLLRMRVPSTTSSTATRWGHEPHLATNCPRPWW